MWLARNKDGKLFIWRIRPIKIGGKWELGIENQCKEPRELVLKPIKEK